MDKENISELYQEYSSLVQFSKANEKPAEKKAIKEIENRKLNKKSWRNNQKYWKIWVICTELQNKDRIRFPKGLLQNICR